jgi:hypothetical protein
MRIQRALLWKRYRAERLVGIYPNTRGGRRDPSTGEPRPGVVGAILELSEGGRADLAGTREPFETDSESCMGAQVPADHIAANLSLVEWSTTRSRRRVGSPVRRDVLVE